MLTRDLAKVLNRYAKFPVVAVERPRQSGKTTLARSHFKKHRYINLENPEMRAFANEDPNRFLRSYFQKQYYNMGIAHPSTYFWRDKNGRTEVDCIVDRGDMLFPIEIKSGETISSSFFSSLSAWTDLAEADPDNATVIYGGSKTQSRNLGNVLPWKKAGQFIPALYQF